MRTILALAAVAAAVLPGAASAATTISFSGVSNNGAFFKTYDGNTVSYPDGISYNDTVSGTVTIDFSAMSLYIDQSWGTTLSYSSLSPAALSYSFASSGINPAPSGSLLSGSVYYYQDNGSDVGELSILSVNRSEGVSVETDTGSIERNLNNRFAIILIGRSHLVLDASGRLLPIFDPGASITFSAQDSDITMTSSGPTTTYAGFGRYSNGTVTSLSGAFVTAGVPEPATWGLMMLGFIGVGHVLRRRPGATARVHCA